MLAFRREGRGKESIADGKRRCAEGEWAPLRVPLGFLVIPGCSHIFDARRTGWDVIFEELP